LYNLGCNQFQQLQINVVLLILLWNEDQIISIFFEDL
jgi:hypothetical protein